MATENSAVRESDDTPPPDDDITVFIGLLNELKSTGCNLLVVGDAPRELFTRASAQLLGDSEELRYRILAATDATSQSIVNRLPDSGTTPRPLTETTHVLNHAETPRSVTTAADSAMRSKLAEIPETRIADPELQGLQSALVDAMTEIVRQTDRLRPAELRVGVDSLIPLLDDYETDVVEECLDVVGTHVHEYEAMAHYVLPAAYESDQVQTLVPNFDAVIELQAVDPDEYDHDAQQRWHAPDRNVTTTWIPL